MLELILILALFFQNPAASISSPQPGETLRGQIRDRGQNFLNDVRHSADARRIELRGRLDSLRAPRNEF